jgi:hypothetical protein
VTIKLTQQDNDNVFFFEDAHAVTAYEEFKYQVKGVQGVDLTNAKLVLDFGGAVPGSTVEIKDIILQEHIEGGTPSGPAPFDPSSADNLWNNAVTTDHHFWFANNDWGAIENATVTSEGGTHTFVLPEGIGSQQWQGQFFFQNTGVKSEAAKTYDFHLVLMSDADHAGVTVKLCAQDDDAAIITDGRYALAAYEEFSLDVYGAAGIDCENLKLVFDFGGGQGGSTVVVKDIVFRESKVAAPEPPAAEEPQIWDASGADNLWNAADKSKLFFYYAPGWAQIDNPEVEAISGGYKIILPEATSERWQAQFAFTELGIAVAADKKYDIQAVLTSTEDIRGVTVKLTDAADDSNFITEGQHDVVAYEQKIIQLPAAAGINAADLDLFFDFGGNPAGAEIEITDIIIREAK